MAEKDTARELTLTRILDAPRELVWKAFTDAEDVKQWYSPHSFTIPEAEVDPRPGGVFRVTMQGPDGSQFPGGGEFREVEPMDRLVTVDTAFDGGLRVRNEITFVDLDGKTEVTLHLVVEHADPAFAGPLSGMHEGWIESLEKLDNLLTGAPIDTSKRSIVASRVLDAPRELVWQAWTEPERLAQWWGPNGFTTTTHQIDVRPGGEWRYTMHGPDGTDYETLVVFLDLAEPERIVSVLGEPGDLAEFLSIVLFSDEGGKTGVSIEMLFPSQEQRDEVVARVGAEKGLEENLDKLGEYLAGQPSILKAHHET